jgi:hypothetical protein
MWKWSAPSDGLDVNGAVKRSGDVLLAGLPEEGDWLPFEERVWDITGQVCSSQGDGGMVVIKKQV